MLIFKKIDFLFLSYILITFIFIIIGWNSAINPLNLLLIRAIILISILGIIFLAEKHKNNFTFLLRQTYPLILSGYFYSETVFFNKLIFSNFDPILEKIETYIFGFQPSVIFSEIFANKVFSELMYFSYFSFYLLIIGFTLAVFFKSKDKFIEGVFRLSASLYIFYIIFVIFPSAGPQFYFPFPDNTLPDAYVFNNIMLLIQELAEQPTGAFPSSHVGVSVIVLMLSKKILPIFYKLALVIVLLLILSTVYIKAHYLIDVIGGIIIAPFILKISDLLYKLLPENIIASKTNTIK